MHRSIATFLLFVFIASTACAAVAAPLVVGYERLLEKDGQPTAMQGRVLMKVLHCMQCHGEDEKAEGETPASLFPVITTATDATELLTQGETLFHSMGCVACHAPQKAPQQHAVADSDDPFADLTDPVGEVVAPEISCTFSIFIVRGSSGTLKCIFTFTGAFYRR